MKTSDPSAHCVIVAAGRGRRMCASLPKQYLQLAGMPILTRTLQVFVACQSITTIVMVVPPEDIDFCRDRIVPAASMNGRVEVVAGGPERQVSVYLGLCALPASGIVLIHDGVRPLVTVGQINQLIEVAYKNDACIPALPLTDTIKRVDTSGCVNITLARENLWRAQTPQAFRTTLIRKAHERARLEGFLGTDDAQLVERLGHPVKTIAGDARNIKITTADDLALAEALLTMLPG